MQHMGSAAISAIEAHFLNNLVVAPRRFRFRNFAGLSVRIVFASGRKLVSF